MFLFLATFRPALCWLGESVNCSLASSCLLTLLELPRPPLSSVAVSLAASQPGLSYFCMWSRVNFTFVLCNTCLLQATYPLSPAA